MLSAAFKMSTNRAQVISEASRKNLLTLKRKSLSIKFDLDGTEYTPIETIGTGAYGVVCSAVHHGTSAKVAIKKIPGIFDNQEMAKRTFREIKILRHFKHDNIISIREILKPKTTEFRDVYIVFDLMESDLHRIIHSKQELLEEHVRYFLYQILRGLKYIHSANVIHRDLKPGNLLINANCELKIGDFGMARGIASGPEEHKYYMTQYVATRWYRAPELMFSLVEYTAAVDVWSVGCIFAEMLGRKQIFPGRDYFEQLKLIIETLGTPSKEFLEMSQSQIVRDLIGGLGHKDPKPFRMLYPKASVKALKLLGQMLVLNPGERITVKAALKHLYLNKYHDPEDEPICTPAFNFDFEKQKLNKEQLKRAIMDEIDDFQNPSLSGLTYNLKFVPKDELEKSSPKPNSSSAMSPRMEAAIKQLQELARQESEKEALQKKNGAVTNKVPDVVVTDSKTAEDVEMHSAKDSQGYPDLKVVSLKAETSTAEVTSVNTTLTSMSETDVDMPSAKRTDSEVKVTDTKRASTDSNKVIERSQSQVEVTDKSNHVEFNERSNTQKEPRDAKAVIKAFLCQKPRLASESFDKSRIQVQPKETARGRHEKREEQRRERRERQRALEKKKLQKKKGDGLVLTEADRSLLERWKTMQQSTKPFVHPIRNHMSEIIDLRAETTQKVDTVDNPTTNQKPINAVVNLDQTELKQDNKIVLCRGGFSGKVSQGAGITPIVTSRVGGVIQPISVPRLTMVSTQVCGTSHPVTVATSEGGDATGQPLLPRQVLTIPQVVSVAQLPAGSHQTTNIDPKFDALHKHGNKLNAQMSTYNQLPSAIQHIATLPQQPGDPCKQMTSVSQSGPVSWSGPPVQTVGLNARVGRADLIRPSLPDNNIILPIPTSISTSHVAPIPASTANIAQSWVSTATSESSSRERLPSYTEAIQAKAVALMRGLPGTIDRQVSDGPVVSPPSSHNTNTIHGLSPKHTLLHLLPDKETIDLTTPPPKPDNSLLNPASSDDQIKISLTVTTSSPGNLGPDWLSTLSKQMHRSHVDELTLAQTPKGTGEGYGVGLDLDSILTDSQPMDGIEQESSRTADSAPLSASLLADWIEVMGPMTDIDLETLEHELAMGSPSVFVDTQI